jgi:hypothetical protein
VLSNLRAVLVHPQRARKGGNYSQIPSGIEALLSFLFTNALDKDFDGDFQLPFLHPFNKHPASSAMLKAHHWISDL